MTGETLLRKEKVWYYFNMRQSCECGCGTEVSGETRFGRRRFVSGHNLKNQKKTKAHREAISEAQKCAWKDNNRKKPIGSTRVNQGYRLVKIKEENAPWKLEHIVIMEKHLERPLQNGEVIHHKNGNKLDNRIENLYLCVSQSEHVSIHHNQRHAY